MKYEGICKRAMLVRAFSIAVVASAFVVGACSSSDSGGVAGSGGESTGGSGGSGASAGTGGSSNGGSATGGSGGTTPTCSQNGTLACRAVIEALCTRRVTCCTNGTACDAVQVGNGCKCLSSACSGYCSGTCEDTCSQKTCVSFMQFTSTSGEDCSAAKFANKTVCEDKTNACIGDTPIVACSDFTDSPPAWNWPKNCSDFWAQF